MKSDKIICRYTNDTALYTFYFSIAFRSHPCLAAVETLYPSIKFGCVPWLSLSIGAKGLSFMSCVIRAAHADVSVVRSARCDRCLLDRALCYSVLCRYMCVY